MNKEVVFKGLVFRGQFPLSSKFKDEPGVYIIADKRNKIADIGETENLKERISSKKRSGSYLWFCKEPSPRNRSRIKKFLSKSLHLAS
jgi:hypothetical protein